MEQINRVCWQVVAQSQDVTTCIVRSYTREMIIIATDTASQSSPYVTSFFWSDYFQTTRCKDNHRYCTISNAPLMWQFHRLSPLEHVKRCIAKHS